MDMHSRQMLNFIAHKIHQENRTIVEAGDKHRLAKKPKRRVISWVLRKCFWWSRAVQRIYRTKPALREGKQRT